MREVAELRRYARRATGSIPAGGERKDAEDELYEHALSLYEGMLTRVLVRHLGGGMLPDRRGLSM
jgi:hypothetical protein